MAHKQILNHLWKIQKWFTEKRLIEFFLLLNPWRKFFCLLISQVFFMLKRWCWMRNKYPFKVSLSLSFDNCNNNKVPFKLNLSIPTFINLNTLCCYCCRWMNEIKCSHHTNVSGCEHRKYEFYANFFPINEREELRQDEVYVTVFWWIFNMILIFMNL